MDGCVRGATGKAGARNTFFWRVLSVLLAISKFYLSYAMHLHVLAQILMKQK